TDPMAWAYVPMFLPVVLVLIAENVGHVRGVATMTNDPSINKHTGRALVADGLATSLAGGFGGSATTTYGENIGVMAATRVYSTAAYWVAGAAAILLAFSPKIGVIFNTIPPGVLGGVTTALYGLIGVIGIKIWVDNRVDFSRPVNQYTVAVSFVIAVGGFAMSWGAFQLGAIVLGTVAALLIYHLGNAIARARKTGADDGGPIPAVGQLGGDPE
ncbi:MAG: solute carrier family 23 protein, partial [Microbacterium sp.]